MPKKNKKKNKKPKTNYNNSHKNYNNNKKKRNKNRKNRKKRDEIDEKFKKSLENLGYFIREVGGDGNCLFRAISEQVEGNEDHYKEYREKCINYMIDHKDEFAPFIEDDESFDDYILRMSKSGEWGGNLEIYAMSKILQANFYIYIYEQPMYVVNNFDKPKKNIKLTYHDGKHYNSLRKLEEKNKEDREKEEKRKKDKENEDNEESDEEGDEEEDDINDLINKVEHLNI